MRHRTTKFTALVLALGLALASCSSSGAAPDKAAGGSGGTAAPAVTTTAAFQAHGSVKQAYVEGATPGQALVLADASGRQVASGTADAFGSLIVRDLEPGDGYTFRAVDGSTVAGSPAFKVLALTDAPKADFYEKQELKVGLNYLTMRDGVTVAATVRLPQGKTLADGPFPTVVEYSGYAVAPPHDPLSALTDPKKAENDPLVPATSTAVGGIIAPLLGFATVSLQMRLRCSGGAMGLFDLPTTADGYDAGDRRPELWVKATRSAGRDPFSASPVLSPAPSSRTWPPSPR
jgi:hypothetical protein